MPPGFGLLARQATSQAAVLISQSPGAFPSGACQEKRQRTRRASAHPNLLFCFPAVQDAVASGHRSRRVHALHACAKPKGALHEPAADQRTPSHSQEAEQGNGDRSHLDGNFERTFKITVIGSSSQSAPEWASRVSMNRREMPPGFRLLACRGTSQAAVLFPQSPGAFPSGACQEKRQRTRRASAHPNLLFCFPAVQDAVAPGHRPRRVHGPNAYAKRKRAFHEPPFSRLRGRSRSRLGGASGAARVGAAKARPSGTLSPPCPPCGERGASNLVRGPDACPKLKAATH